jgi:hypothetical protein
MLIIVISREKEIFYGSITKKRLRYDWIRHTSLTISSIKLSSAKFYDFLPYIEILNNSYMLWISNVQNPLIYKRRGRLDSTNAISGYKLWC